MGLQEPSAEFGWLDGAQIRGSDIENRTAAALSFLIQPVSGSCISDKDGSSKFRIGIQLEAVFDHMLVLIVPASSAAMDHKAAVRDSGDRKSTRLNSSHP